MKWCNNANKNRIDWFRCSLELRQKELKSLFIIIISCKIQLIEAVRGFTKKFITNNIELEFGQRVKNKQTSFSTIFRKNLHFPSNKSTHRTDLCLPKFIPQRWKTNQEALLCRLVFFLLVFIYGFPVCAVSFSIDKFISLLPIVLIHVRNVLCRWQIYSLPTVTPTYFQRTQVVTM